MWYQCPKPANLQQVNRTRRLAGNPMLAADSHSCLAHEPLHDSQLAGADGRLGAIPEIVV